MTQQQSDFFKTTVPAAQASMAATGVPASVTLAQAILESGWGHSQLAQTCNNFFGIKCAHLDNPEGYREFMTAEWVQGRSVRELQPFARYADAAEGFKSHGRLISESRRYSPAMRVRGEIQKFCDQLKACGYSTLPDYSAKLMQLIREFDLTQYDSPGPEPKAAAKEAA